MLLLIKMQLTKCSNALVSSFPIGSKAYYSIPLPLLTLYKFTWDK